MCNADAGDWVAGTALNGAFVGKAHIVGSLGTPGWRTPAEARGACGAVITSSSLRYDGVALRCKACQAVEDGIVARMAERLEVSA